MGLTLFFCAGLKGMAQEQSARIHAKDSLYLFQRHNELFEIDFGVEHLQKPALDLNYRLPSISGYKATQKLGKSLLAPAILAGVGLYSGSSAYSNHFMGKKTIHIGLQNEFEGFRSYADDYIQWGPIAMCYGLKAFGVKGANNVWVSTKLLLKAELLTAGLVYVLKRTTGNSRPDNSYNTHSFPSGHTSQAFVAATFLHREYGHVSPWYSVTGYCMATTVGAMRMLNRRHWFNDVTVGAAMGIAITNLIYWQHERRNDKKSRQLAAIPAFSSEGAGLFVMMHF